MSGGLFRIAPRTLFLCGRGDASRGRRTSRGQSNGTRPPRLYAKEHVKAKPDTSEPLGLPNLAARIMKPIRQPTGWKAASIGMRKLGIQR